MREAYDCFRREGHKMEYLLIEGLGHHWALEHDINAKIWRFLSPHRLFGVGSPIRASGSTMKLRAIRRLNVIATSLVVDGRAGHS